MPRSLVPVLGLLGLALLCFLCVRCHAPRIEAELLAQGRQRLEAGSFDPATLAVGGRDATLAGVVRSEPERARIVRLVAEIPGIRRVDDRLRLPEPVRFELDRSAGAVALKGRLPNQARRDAIVSRARELWGAETSADELTVDRAVEEPDWLDGLPDALRSFSRRTENGSFVIDGGELTIGGRMYAESARQALLERLGVYLPGLEVSDRSEVRPPATAAELQSTLDTAVLLRTVEFASDSAELTALGRSVLDEIFELLSGQRAVRVAISGHTDDQGDEDYNLDLSRRRARAAGDYLAARGLAADRFETAGFGESQPIADNATPQGRHRNRRIEFAVQEEEESP